MSRVSEDSRTATQELGVVLKWTLITIVIIGVLCIATALWAFGQFHFLTLGA